MDVKLGGGGFAGELAEAVGEQLLQIVVEVVLFAEEDNAAAGDCGC